MKECYSKVIRQGTSLVVAITKLTKDAGVKEGDYVYVHIRASDSVQYHVVDQKPDGIYEADRLEMDESPYEIAKKISTSTEFQRNFLTDGEAKAFIARYKSVPGDQVEKIFAYMVENGFIRQTVNGLWTSDKVTLNQKAESAPPDFDPAQYIDDLVSMVAPGEAVPRTEMEERAIKIGVPSNKALIVLFAAEKAGRLVKSTKTDEKTNIKSSTYSLPKAASE